MVTPTFNQLATLLNSIYKQATGQTTLTPTNAEDFVSLATKTLATGYDPVLNAISSVLSKTIFSVGPYNRKFGGLYMDSVRYGNHVRKLTTCDKDFEEDDRIKLTDGQSVNQQIVNKPTVLQTNYYGIQVFQKSLTLFKDQLDVAFSSPEEFGRFIAMVMQNVKDQIEQAHESVARALVTSFIGAKIDGDSKNVRHMLTEYNTYTGKTLTQQTIREPENWTPFVKWLFAEIKTQSDNFTERTIKYHTNITGYDIPRHTPLEKQKLYMYAPVMNQIDTNVLSGIWNMEFMKIIDFEKVNFWQSVDTPMEINVDPVYIDSNGVQTKGNNVHEIDVLGVHFDEECIGITQVNEWSANAPFNAKGGYTNTFWHFSDRYFMDMTENGIVYLLD